MEKSGRLDKTTPHETQAGPAWDALANPNDLWVEMPKGAHYSFITICHDLDSDLVELFQEGADEDGCGDAFTPTTETVPTLAACALGFANWHLLGEKKWKPILRGKPFAKGFAVETH